MAYATVTDIEGRWRELTEDESAKAQVLLEDATAYLDAMVDMCHLPAERASLLRTVCCNMVIRSMVASASSAYGLESLQATMGPFAQTAQFANPNGDLYLTKLEKKLLGISGGKGRMLYPYDVGEQTYDA